MAEAIKQRENLYKLIISQLRYDGCEAVAAALAKTTNIISPCPPSARLHQIVNLGLNAESGGARPEQSSLPGLTLPSESTLTAKGIDLEYESEECNGINGQSADEGFMSNLDLQKVSCDSGSGGESDRENIPPTEEVHRHILKITTSKIAADEINVVSSNGEQLLQGDGVDDICTQVKRELQKMNVSQEVFAKCVLGKTQGYLSEMLKHGERVFCPSEKSSSKGRLNFERMRQFLARPEGERRQIYTEMAQRLREERMARKRLCLTMASSPEDMNKKQRYILDDGKKVMDGYYETCPQLLTPGRTQELCERLTIPEQTVGDFYKNLHCKKSPEERLQITASVEKRNDGKIQSCVASTSKGSPHKPTFMAVRSSPSSFSESSHPHCGKTEFVSTMEGTPQKPRRESEQNLVASKIAALSRNQPTPKSKQNKSSQRSVQTPTKESGGQSNYNIQRNDVIEIKTLPLESLADMDSSHLVLHGQPIEPRNIEIGQQIYVVQVDGSDAISVTSSL